MSTAHEQPGINHRVIITYLCIILCFALLSIGVWSYFNAQGRAIHEEVLTPGERVSTDQPQ